MSAPAYNIQQTRAEKQEQSQLIQVQQKNSIAFLVFRFTVSGSQFSAKKSCT